VQKFTLIHFTQQANLEIPLTTAKLTYKTAHYNIKMTYTTLTEKAKITKTKTYNVKQSYQLHTHTHARTHTQRHTAVQGSKSQFCKICNCQKKQFEGKDKEGNESVTLANGFTNEE